MTTEIRFGEGSLQDIPEYLADTIDWEGKSEEYQESKVEAGLSEKEELDSYSGDTVYWSWKGEVMLVDRNVPDGQVLIWSSPYVSPVAEHENGGGDLSQPRTYKDLQEGNAVLAYVPNPRWFREVRCGNIPENIIYPGRPYPFETPTVEGTERNLVQIDPTELTQMQTLLTKTLVSV